MIAWLCKPCWRLGNQQLIFSFCSEGQQRVYQPFTWGWMPACYRNLFSFFSLTLSTNQRSIDIWFWNFFFLQRISASTYKPSQWGFSLFPLLCTTKTQLVCVSIQLFGLVCMCRSPGLWDGSVNIISEKTGNWIPLADFISAHSRHQILPGDWC